MNSSLIKSVREVVGETFGEFSTPKISEFKSGFTDYQFQDLIKFNLINWRRVGAQDLLNLKLVVGETFLFSKQK